MARPGGGGVEGDEVEFVRGAGVKVELDGYAGLAEAQGVGEVFVAEHVELGDLDVGGRQRGRVGDVGRGGVGGGVRRPPTQLPGLARPGAGTGRPAAGYPVTSSAR
jgi:hypothetical protein